MVNIKFTLIYSTIIGVILFSTSSFSMFCPENFNAIEIGYTMDQIIQLCGSPDERSEYKETVTFSDNNIDGQSYGNYYQSSNNYYSQSQGNYQQLKNVKEKIIIHTKFIYHFPQPAALIFENGILKDRELIH